MARQITSISSPFAEQSDDFEATLTCPDQAAWLNDLPDAATLTKSAPWEFTFNLENNRLAWTYKFKKIRGVSLPGREATETTDGLLLDPRDLPESDRATFDKSKSVRSTSSLQDGIGAIKGTLFVYDRDPEVLGRIGFTQSIQTFLDETGGMRVYRDGIRVYNYGEPGDDWLALDIRRVNSPSKRISNNIVIGAISLNLETSPDLIEKTNREGFVENEAYARLRALIRGIVNVFEIERNKDKLAIRKLLAKDRSAAPGSIERPLAKIRSIARNNGLATDIEPLLATAQKTYDEMRTIMLRAGISNMSLVLVYHEIEHGMRLLERNLRRSDADASAVEYAKNLVGVIDGFGDLLRKNQPEDHDLRNVVERAVDLNSVRLENHEVAIQTQVDWAPGATEPISRIPLGLVLGAITNLVDNSIYWLAARYPDHSGDNTRRLFIAVDTETFEDGPAIIVADNGPGFVDEMSEATEPFFTRRPDGMGVGLYYVNLIMHTIGGELRLLGRGDASVPSRYDGAALALIFPRS